MRLFMVYSACNNLDRVGRGDAATASPTACETFQTRTIVVGVSVDGGLTWTDHIAMQAPLGSVLGQLIPWIAVSPEGTIYVAAAGWIVDENDVKKNGLFMSASTDHGTTWTPIARVNAGGGDTAFPTVAAGRNGVADFAWVESTSTDQSDNTGAWASSWTPSAMRTW